MALFNDYNDNGYRINKHGNRSSRTEDNSIVYNMRYKHPEELKKYSDVEIVNMYDDWFLDERFGNDDERFLEFLEELEAENG